MASGPFYVRRSMCNAASDTGNSHQCCIDQALNNAGADRDSHDNGFHQDQKIRKQIDALNNTTSNEATALMQAEDLLRFTEKSPMLESQSLSQNVKLGLQYRYQQGKVVQLHHQQDPAKREIHGLFLLQDRPSLYLCQNAAIFIGLVCIIQTGIHTILYPLKANISNALSKFSSFTRM